MPMSEGLYDLIDTLHITPPYFLAASLSEKAVTDRIKYYIQANQPEGLLRIIASLNSSTSSAVTLFSPEAIN